MRKKLMKRKGKAICLVENERMQYKVACLVARERSFPSFPLFLPSFFFLFFFPSPLPVTLDQGARNLHATTLGARRDLQTRRAYMRNIKKFLLVLTTIKLRIICLFGLIKSIPFNCQLELLGGKYTDMFHRMICAKISWKRNMIFNIVCWRNLKETGLFLIDW